MIHAEFHRREQRPRDSADRVRALLRVLRQHLRNRRLFLGRRLTRQNREVQRVGRVIIVGELRNSLDARNSVSYLKIRGKNYFDRILRNVSAFRALQKRDTDLTARKLCIR